ncbi:hypothetical protein WICMUC_003527 [Wickerhamomyces mucosus]|uniref:Uncharacterized protein n=1 Tax=Wickerhamomyces mucosus TaxID=1378264 RepID=A0A9P8TCF3_9ASCO|nr:hypothetical protein WICMUC_003527 [Wickerhamomyces mucosus]
MENNNDEKSFMESNNVFISSSFIDKVAEFQSFMATNSICFVESARSSTSMVCNNLSNLSANGKIESMDDFNAALSASETLPSSFAAVECAVSWSNG